MKDVFKTIELKKIKFEDIKNENGEIIDCKPIEDKRKYMLIMNINVLDQLDSIYKNENKDGFEQWSELASEKSSEQYRALTEFLCLCVNEGIRLENKHRKEVGLKELDKFRPDEITLDLFEMIKTVTKLIKESNENGKEENEKN